MGALDDARRLLQSNAEGSVPQAFASAELAAADGDPEADLLLALLSGAGVGTVQDWPRALHHLEAAAGRGSETARGQLAVLDATDWTAMANKQALSAAPRSVTIDGFLSPEVCAWIIDRARGRMGQT